MLAAGTSSQRDRPPVLVVATPGVPVGLSLAASHLDAVLRADLRGLAGWEEVDAAAFAVVATDVVDVAVAAAVVSLIAASSAANFSTLSNVSARFSGVFSLSGGGEALGFSGDELGVLVLRLLRDRPRDWDRALDRPRERPRGERERDRPRDFERPLDFERALGRNGEGDLGRERPRDLERARGRNGDGERLGEENLDLPLRP